jgi:hypothetical protein
VILEAMVVIPWLLAMNGCSTTQHVQTYVQDASVHGPVMSPPVHVVTDNARHAMTVSAYATSQQMNRFKGAVEGTPSGFWLPQWDTVRTRDGRPLRSTVSSSNLTWNQPDFSGGVDLDVVWSTTALSLGGTFATGNGSTQGGWQAGVGFCSAETSSFKVRFDAGLFGQFLDFESRSVTITTTTSEWWGTRSTTVDTSFYLDRDSRSGLGYYGSLTINSAKPSWLFNIFIQANFIVQPLLSYTPVERTTVDWALFLPIESTSGSGEVTTRATFLGITPGIYIEPTPSTVLLAGVRYMYDVSGTLKEPRSVAIPFVQFGLRAGM